MPRISDQFTDCAVYIYRSLQDARNGERQGGSGFVVSVPLESNASLCYVYVTTNAHVVRRARTPVIRLNRKDGSSEFLETELGDWTFHPDGDDIAIRPIPLNPELHNLFYISVLSFITPQLVIDEDVGVGDDTFMIGRFINHEGRQQNTPAVRFGNIAMMPKERIVSEHGIAQESFLVEIRSLPGYSGSAVFIYFPFTMNDMSVRRFGHDRPRAPREEPRGILPKLDMEDFEGAMRTMLPKGPYLLGIDWCHLPNVSKVRDKSGVEIEEGWTVSENTGMAGVIPAWKIAEVLNCEEVLNLRRASEKQWLDSQNRVGG